MRKAALYILSWGILMIASTAQTLVAQHPMLVFTEEEISLIQESYQEIPLYLAEVEEAESLVSAAIEAGIDVPVPKDMAGGYTHSQHKQNWIHMRLAGILYQITRKESYANYVREMLLKYAELYPTLGLHPTQASYSTGKIFWQCLNDANWLVYTAQAYDCVYDFLNAADHEILERQLFRPMARFLSEENPQFFNRIHNHSTWACAAVGMIGLVMQDEELVNRALYGLPDSLAPSESVDNDGGIIEGAGSGQKGFFAQLDQAFSPDGFFTEGPYYLRYALSPYLLFANGLENSPRKVEVFAYRNEVLRKAIYALLTLSDARGWVFPVNDAQKGMSWKAPSIVSSIDIAYHRYGQDPRLLDIAGQQNGVSLDYAGFQVARDIDAGKTQAWIRRAATYTDGPDGTSGGFAVLSAGNTANSELTLALTYAAHGGGHGHFDRLSYSLYDDRGEVVQDYGAARWVNIRQQGGGRYLPENKTWAKQTVAHNTLVVDGRSQSGGKVQVADSHAPSELFFFEPEGEFQAIAVVDSLSYASCIQTRTMIMASDPEWDYPLVIDLIAVSSETEHEYDLPTWYQGHFLETNGVERTPASGRSVLGNTNGYQHLWVESTASAIDSMVQTTWFDGQTFTSISSVASPGDDSLIWVRLGANDPEVNLRNDPGFIFRKRGTDAVFFSVIEHHGAYDPALEIPSNPFSKIQHLSILMDDQAYTVLNIMEKSDRSHLVLLAKQETGNQANHTLNINGHEINWTGPVQIISHN